MAHMFVLVWPLLLVWCWWGFLLMGSFAGCLLFDTGDDLLDEPFRWLNQSEKPRQEQRPWKGKGSLHSSLFHIVSYCLNQPRYWRSLWSQYVSLVEVSPSFRIPMGGQDVEFKLNLFATRLGKCGELALFAVAPWTLTIWGPYPPTVIVSWQSLRCCTETVLQHLESSGIIRTWPKRRDREAPQIRWFDPYCE